MQKSSRPSQDITLTLVTNQNAFVPRTRGPRRRFSLYLLAVLSGLLLIWLGVDLYGPWTADLRRFDPAEVARLETAMWRSYYDKQPFNLFLQLGKLMRTEYHLPFFRSNLIAYHASRAAFVFKRGHERSDYEEALPFLEKYFEAIKRIGTLSFDTHQIAKLELEWWILHRERDKYLPGELDQAVARVTAELYQIPFDQVAEHGRLRAQAMLLRDSLAADAGTVADADWARIANLLSASWHSLAKALSP